jgi:hypothetical protein
MITKQEDVARLENQLRGRLSGRVRALRLFLRDQGLVLQGQARTYYAKQLAQQAVMEAAPYPIQANEIEVV